MFVTFIVWSNELFLANYLRNFLSLPSLVCMYVQLVISNFHVV